MNLLIIADAIQKEELCAGGFGSDVHIEWANGAGGVDRSRKVDGCIDLLFENNTERVQRLKELQAPVVIINSVMLTLEEIREDFVRINGWHTFLKRPVIEAASQNEWVKEKAENIFSRFDKSTEWVPDIPGFITPRVIAAIINEAYFSLEEQVSGKKGMDIAMKSGTNYPYGPFEWSEKIGLKNIHALLLKLASLQKRYEPSALLTKEAMI